MKSTKRRTPLLAFGVEEPIFDTRNRPLTNILRSWSKRTGMSDDDVGIQHSTVSLRNFEKRHYVTERSVGHN